MLATGSATNAGSLRSQEADAVIDSRATAFQAVAKQVDMALLLRAGTLRTAVTKG